MIFIFLQSYEYKTQELDIPYMLTVTGDGIEDRVEFVLEDENITHIVISSYNNGSLAFTQVELALQFRKWSVSNFDGEIVS